MTEALKELFLASFSDPKEVVDEIFKNFVTEKNAFFICDSGRPVSAMYAVEKKIRIKGKRYPLPFIMGVSTYPEYQGKGLSTKLMGEALNTLSDAPFVMLGTAIPDFYRRTGFANVSYSCETKNLEKGEEITADKMLEFYERVVKKGDYYIEWSLEDFEKRRILGKKANAPFRYLLREGKICGFSDGQETVDENPEKISSFTMARIVSLKTVAEIAENLPFTFRLADPIIKENNGIFAIKGKELILTDTFEKDLDIKELTSLVFDGMDGYIFDAY